MLVGVLVGVRVGVCVGVLVGAATTILQALNSEVLLLGSVAVAVTACPTVTALGTVSAMLAFPLPSVPTVVDPRKTFPSPFPAASQVGTEKNSTVNGVVLGRLLNVPRMLVLPPPDSADDRTGKFCSLLAPRSGS